MNAAQLTAVTTSTEQDRAKERHHELQHHLAAIRQQLVGIEGQRLVAEAELNDQLSAELGRQKQRYRQRRRKLWQSFRQLYRQINQERREGLRQSVEAHDRAKERIREAFGPRLASLEEQRQVLTPLVAEASRTLGHLGQTAKPKHQRVSTRWSRQRLALVAIGLLTVLVSATALAVDNQSGSAPAGPPVAAWAPSTIQFWQKALGAALADPRVAVSWHGRIVNPAADQPQLVYLRMLLGSGGNPAYQDNQLIGLVPMDRLTALVLSQQVRLGDQFADPADPAVNLRLAIRQINELVVAEWQRRGKTGQYDVELVKAVVRGWNPAYSPQFVDIYAQLYLDWERAASPLYQQIQSKAALRSRLELAEVVLRTLKRGA